MRPFNLPLTATTFALLAATLLTAGCGGGDSAGSTAPQSDAIGISAPTGSTPSTSTPTGNTGTVTDPATGVVSDGTSTEPGDTPVSSPVTEPLSAEAAEATTQANSDTIAVNAALEQTTHLTETEGGRSVTRAEGEYPKIGVDRTEAGFVVTVDYGTAPVTTTGGREISGVFTITRNRVEKTGSVSFSNVTINGHTVTGTATLTNLEVSRDSVSATRSHDLTIGGVGHSVGTSDTTAERATRLLTIVAGSNTFTPEGTTKNITTVPANLVLNPVVNGNLVPQSGTRTVTYPVTVGNRTVTATAVVTYSEKSPATGVVSVSVNGTPAQDYVLPRFQ